MFSHLFDLPSWWAIFVSTLLGQLPRLLVKLAGMLVAMWFWRSVPRTARLVLAGCLLMFLVNLFEVGIFGMWLPWAQSNNRASDEMIMHVMGLWSFVGQLLDGCATGLLVWAAFSGRARAVSAS